MKITVLTSSVSRSAGGLFDAVKDLSKNIENSDIQVLGLSDQYTQEDIHSWSPLKISTFNGIGSFGFSLGLRNAVLRDCADLLHLHGLWMYPHQLVNVWKNHNKYKPVLISPHGMLNPYTVKHRSKLKTWGAHLLFATDSFKNADCFHALNSSEVDAIRKYGISKPVAVIPNGISLPARKKVRVYNDSKRKLLYLGRLNQIKGLENLIKAFAIIKKETDLLQKWELNIVGWSQENYETTLRKITTELNVTKSIHFLGPMFGQDKEDMLLNSDGFILPSYSEGIPISVLEAWSYSLPVIMTGFCNIPDGFKYNAALFIEPNEKHIASALISFFSMTDFERNKIGDNGYTLVKNSFTWDIIAEKMKKLYEWILNGGEKPDFVHL